MRIALYVEIHSQSSAYFRIADVPVEIDLLAHTHVQIHCGVRPKELLEYGRYGVEWSDFMASDI
jgi:hypothetical protein